MDHYYKGRNEEEHLSKENIPFEDLPENFSWAEVTGSSRVRALVGPLGKQLRQEKVLVVSGSGASTGKAVTLAEIIKRRQKHVHQRMEVGERIIQEFWEPKPEIEGLDTLVVTRRIPTLHILLDINKTTSAYVTPDEELYEAMWGSHQDNKKSKRREKTGK